MTYLYRFIKYALALLALGWTAQTLWFHSLPRVQLQVNSRPLRVAIADTPARQAWGLMYRIALADGEGMLFVYSAPRGVCMWMRNTFIPLSVAFIGQDGIVRGLEDMQPLTRQLHCSPAPVTYALEVPAGWFGASAVNVGTRISGLPLPSR